MGWQDAGDVSQHAQGVAAALDDLQRFPPPDAALQTAHFVDKARGALALLLRVADVRPEVLLSLAAVADFGYAWGLLQAHVPRLHALVSVASQHHRVHCGRQSRVAVESGILQ